MKHNVAIHNVALATIAIGIPVAGMAAGAAIGTATAAAATAGTAGTSATVGTSATAATSEPALGPAQAVASYVKRLEGTPYRWGGTSPSSGFDCSGLTRYVYARYGRLIARTAQGQFRQFRSVRKSRAWGGDLVFFHTDSNPSSPVYHVGVYEGGNSMVAASSGAGRVIWQSFTWAGDTVTFGTITH